MLTHYVPWDEVFSNLRTSVGLANLRRDMQAQCHWWNGDN